MIVNGQSCLDAPGADRPRRRWLVAACLATTIAAGLASRTWPLPGLLAEYAGDALYTVAAFFGWAWLFPVARGAWLAVVAFLSSSLVEFSQLVQWAWLAELRATRLGALVLGQGFQWVDLLAYAVGAVVVVVFDVAMRSWRR